RRFESASRGAACCAPTIPGPVSELSVVGVTVVDRRPGVVGLLLLAAACRGAAPGADQARSDSALTARTWGLAYLQWQQLPRAEADFRKVVTLAPDPALRFGEL